MSYLKGEGANSFFYVCLLTNLDYLLQDSYYTVKNVLREWIKVCTNKETSKFTTSTNL